jgi:hypothetical protein
MPHQGLLLLSLSAMVIGTMYFLFPRVLLRVGQALNRFALQASDERMLRYRYLIGLIFFIGGYGLFKLALLISEDSLQLLVPFH